MHVSLWIFLGGGLGALSRWLLSVGIEKITHTSAFHRFPLGILMCNLLGCLAIGALFGALAPRHQPSWVFPFWVTGFLGGFTTFSTFGNDTHRLLTDGFHGLALANILASTLGGLAMVFLGYRMTQA
ncbi:MAG: fluoride efflux transporter CrcB [Akkermansiaceae bacterium]|jgi:CrcB protein|nr:fluoride efflux transporter CrcB [Akkermansiaceae bacterium]